MSSYDLDTIFIILGHSVSLLQGRGSVKWIPSDDTGDREAVVMDLAEFVMRSFASELIEKNEDYEDVKKIAEKHGIEIDDAPSYSVIFQRVGGKRRLTRRTRSRK